jgi:hypothetical protein
MARSARSRTDHFGRAGVPANIPTERDDANVSVEGPESLHGGQMDGGMDG